MERRIDLEGCYNFRDLGGYPTADGRRLRWRRLFRSDGLQNLTLADVARLRDEIGLAHVVDLRSSKELRIEGRGALEREPMRFHHLPLFDGGFGGGQSAAAVPDLAELYFIMAEFAREPVARVISTLARASGPAVFHCAAGKDRTGLISAVLLGLLGVPDEVVVADYAVTREGLEGFVEKLLGSESYQDVLELLPADTLHSEPATMSTFLERIRERYGSMRGYVAAIGVEEADVARIGERLLERD